MTPVEELLARRQIEDTLAAYCNGLDRMDLDPVGLLFTLDCTVSYGPHPDLQAHGRAALVASLARLWRWRRTAHHLCNVLVRFDGVSEAAAESRVHAWHEAPDGTEAEIFGTYRDTLVHKDNAWLIHTRAMEMNGSRGGFRVPVPPAFRHPPPDGWTPPTGLDG